jgi:hypothetical protein
MGNRKEMSTAFEEHPALRDLRSVSLEERPDGLEAKKKARRGMANR